MTSTSSSTTDGVALLERDAELAAIAAIVESTTAGSGRLVAIEARAGMGKTCLVAAARGIAEAAGMDALSARGGELERDFAWGVVRQLFEPLVARGGREELLAGAAGLAGRLFDEPHVGEDGADGDVSFSFLHGLYWLAANAAQSRPTVLTIDDVQWADRPSLRWLAYLARRLEGLPLLVVVGTRPPDQSRETDLLTELLADPAAVAVHPGALSVGAVGTLAAQMLGAEGDADFVRACHEATGGNALFVRALLDTLAAEHIAPVAANAARVLEIGPESVARIVALRLARMPAEAGALARAAAVLGDGCEPEHAAALAALDDAAAIAAATALGRADLLRPGTPLEFVHPVVRTAVYERIPAGERPLEHRRAASVLTERGAGPEPAAAHLLRTPPAGDLQVAVTLRLAARRALGHGSPEAAVQYLERALEEVPTDAFQAELLVELGLALRRLDNAAAAAALERAVEVMEEGTRRTQLVLEWGRCLVRSRQHLRGMEVFRTELDRVPAGAEHDELRWLLRGELLSSAWWEPAQAPVLHEQLAAIEADELPQGLPGDVVRAQLAYGETRKGERRDRAVSLALEAATPELFDAEASWARYYAGYVLIAAGATEEARRFHDLVLEAARRRGDLVTIAGTLVFRGLLFSVLGELQRAESDLRAAQSIDEQYRLQAALPYHTAWFASTLTQLGKLDGAEAVLAGAGYPDPIPANAHLLLYLQARGELRLARRDAEGALADLRLLGEHAEAVGIPNPAFLPWRSRAATALHLLDRRDEALPLALEEVELARRWGDPRTTGLALCAAGAVAGGAEGLELLRDAVDVLAPSSARLAYAQAQLELGSALRRGNRRSDAREHLRQALELAHRCGAEPLAEQAQTELAATGARPRRLVLTGVDALTPSERRVAELAAESLTNKEIAQALFVTTKTVEVHLSSVYRKLEIASRGQLGAALAAGVAPVPV